MSSEHTLEHSPRQMLVCPNDIHESCVCSRQMTQAPICFHPFWENSRYQRQNRNLYRYICIRSMHMPTYDGLRLCQRELKTESSLKFWTVLARSYIPGRGVGDGGCYQDGPISAFIQVPFLIWCVVYSVKFIFLVIQHFVQKTLFLK